MMKIKQGSLPHKLYGCKNLTGIVEAGVAVGAGVDGVGDGDGAAVVGDGDGADGVADGDGADGVGAAVACGVVVTGPWKTGKKIFKAFVAAGMQGKAASTAVFPF